jgi:hypothetical protein
MKVKIRKNVKVEPKPKVKKPELELCPFCGTLNGAVLSYPQAVIKCLHCGAMGPIVRLKADELGNKLFKNVEEAIAGWNNRKG